MYILKLHPVGASTGTTIPDELLAKLHAAAGDTLYVTETPDGGFRLSPCNPEVARQMEIAEQIMRDDREVLRALAR